MNTCWADFNSIYSVDASRHPDRMTTLAAYCAHWPQIGEKILCRDMDEYSPQCEAEVVDIVPSEVTRGSYIVYLKLDWSTLINGVAPE